jgi:hypothetical protein
MDEDPSATGAVVMSHLFGLLRAILINLAPPAILIWAVQRWWHTSPKISEPAWRSYFAFAAISLAGISSLLWLISEIWAVVIGGFPYYDPVLLRFYRWGGWTGLAGLLASLAGKGKLRWPAFGLSFLMEVFWASAAIGE